MSNMNEDTISKIYSKHAAALAAVAQNERVHLDAARIALALAMHEMNKPVDRRIHEQVMAQILRLNEWLAENAIDLYQDGTTDTGEAMVKAANRLAAQLAQVRTELAAAIDERNFADKRCAELEADLDNLRDATVESSRDIDEVIAERNELRQQLAAIHSNGKSAPAAVLVQAFDSIFQKATPSTDYISLDWSSLSQAAQDYRIGLDAGRWKWRDIPKTVRLELVRCVIRNAGEMPTQAQFDAIRPRWMATATAQCSAFAVQWGILANLDREIEVTP